MLVWKNTPVSPSVGSKRYVTCCSPAPDIILVMKAYFTILLALCVVLLNLQAVEMISGTKERKESHKQFDGHYFDDAASVLDNFFGIGEALTIKPRHR
ncbi:hypothetical protein NPIL_634181, partial [Nephila pilipes]